MAPNLAEGAAYDNLGRSLQHSADTATKIIQKEAAEQDASRAIKTAADYDSEQNKFLYGYTGVDPAGNPTKTPGVMHAVGEDAVNPADGVELQAKFQEWNKGYADTVREQLGNQRQKDLFDAHVARSNPHAEKAVMEHVFKQGQVVKVTNAKAAVDIGEQTMVSMGADPNVTPEMFQAQEEKLKESIRAYAAITLGGQAQKSPAPADNTGLVEKSNIDLAKRPQVKNADGSVSTVRSLGVNIDGQEVLIPTVSPDGKILSDQEAVDLYKQTGQHLGKFDSEENSTKYAKDLHTAQENFYGNERDSLAVKNLINKSLTTAYVKTSKSLIAQGKIEDARDFWDAAVEKGGIAIDSVEYADMVHRLDGAEASSKGSEFADSLWKPPANNAPVTDHAAMFKTIETAIKDGSLTKEAGKIAEAELSQKITRYNLDVTAYQHQFKGDVWDGIDKGKLNMRSAFARVDASGLPGDDRVILKKQIEHYFKPPADPEAKLMQRYEQDAQFADLLGKVSRGEVRIQDLKQALPYTGTIGRSNVFKLASYAQKYETALASPSMVDAQLGIQLESLRDSGVTIPEKNSNEYNALKGYIQNNIVDSQVKKGKLLNEEDTKKVIRQRMEEDIPVYTKGGWWHLPSTVYTETKKGWQVQNPNSIDIPSLLQKRLGRKATADEVSNARKALLKPAAARQDVRKNVPFGGIE